MCVAYSKLAMFACEEVDMQPAALFALIPFHSLHPCTHTLHSHALNTGGLIGKSLLAKDQPSVWYMAAAALPSLQVADGIDKPPLNDEQVDQLRMQCDTIIANEVAAFDRDLKRRNAADYKWIMQVKRSGTTSDKVAAITLQVLVR